MRWSHYGCMDEPRWSLFPPARRLIGLDPTGGASRTFIGGMRLALWNATWPLVRLSLFAHGVRLEASVWILKVLVPTWEATYEDIVEVQAMGRISLVTTGIRFRTRSTNEWVIFWTLRRPEVLQAIAEKGLVVNADPVRFRYL